MSATTMSSALRQLLGPALLAISVGACEVAELSPPAAETRERDTGSAAETSAPLAETDAALEDHGPEAEISAVVERETCGPCAERARSCEAGACGEWSACEAAPCRPQGLLCGLHLNERVGTCADLDPALACPGGYAQIVVRGGGGDTLTTCALTTGNCQGAECVAERLPAGAVCGIWHDALETGIACDGVLPAENMCPHQMTWTGHTDFGMPAGFGLQVCVATGGGEAHEGLCGWRHTRSSISGGGAMWCPDGEAGGCPDDCALVGPEDIGSGADAGWMTCACSVYAAPGR